MIGWENNQGAYFINKLNDSIDSVDDKIDSEVTALNAKLLKYYDTEEGIDLTAGTGNYAQIARPESLANKTIVALSVKNWTSNSGAFSLVAYGTGNQYDYMMADKDVQVKGLKIRYWYI